MVAGAMGLQTWSGDLDYGEMFHNYKLHPDLRPYADVDASFGGDELVRDNHLCPKNLLQWDIIVLSTPDGVDYQPMVSK
eukprot:4508332-Ditylum_brightwellii.AAC.1